MIKIVCARGKIPYVISSSYFASYGSLMLRLVDRSQENRIVPLHWTRNRFYCVPLGWVNKIWKRSSETLLKVNYCEFMTEQSRHSLSLTLSRATSSPCRFSHFLSVFSLRLINNFLRWCYLIAKAVAVTITANIKEELLHNLYTISRRENLIINIERNMKEHWKLLRHFFNERKKSLLCVTV